jgi:hypothetical protein
MGITSKKIDDSHTLYYDNLTNDPIATSSKVPYGWGKKFVYHIKWHPDFKQMYPESNDFIHRNFQDADAAGTALNYVEGQYDRVQKGQRDPLRTKFLGVMEKHLGEPNRETGEVELMKLHQYHVLDHEGNPFATLSIRDQAVPYIGHSDEYRRHASTVPMVTFHGTAPDSNQQELLLKHNGEKTVVGSLHRLAHWLNIKDKEMSFVGHEKSGDYRNSYKSFKTKLQPDVASSKYEDHVRAKHSDLSNFVRHSPTLFTFSTGKDTDYNLYHHIVNSNQPGMLEHTQRRDVKSQNSKNDEVIE